MDLTQLEQRLLTAARRDPPNDHVPLAFEKRVMALLGTSPAPDHWGQWAHGLWRAAAPCLAVAALIAGWAMLDISRHASSGDLSQEFENTILAAVQAEAHAE